MASGMRLRVTCAYCVERLKGNSIWLCLTLNSAAAYEYY